ncbi:conserved repeat domain protein [Paenibacillus curdlanolyticus YK9]|uniref:Conserved repeat domain protein n=1 Tax=Paenibacillus curdlanolyticus YK9 TaxID=717606 RepID=E0IFZ4_9BACL|nr:DUF11 domain-containing protein [Paenibacillus curdlanolyticus]EFM08574.1 conserved repeat domain protein [Paenibacillus curdlanolyticus YK9]
MASERPTNDSAQADYWIGSGESVLFDAGQNQGAGGFVTYNDLLRISKGAQLVSSENCDCKATVTLDLDAKAASFEYYPSHPLDVVFVLDVTSSMMSGSSLKFAQAKRAIIATINQMWAVNRNTTVTIVPYGRDAFLPNQSPSTGFSYNYLGTLFQWKRSSSFPGYYIGQILGYRNQSNVSAAALTTFLTQSAPMAASAELSLYNYYNYYKIKYSDIYDDAGVRRPDTVLSNYLATVYNPALPAYNSNQIKSVATGTPLTATELPYSMNDSGYANNTILDNLMWAIPYSEDTNTEAGVRAAYELFKTPGFAQSDDILRRAVILITDGQANRSINPNYPNSYAAPGDTDATFFPDVPNDPWKYFVQLQQSVPTLVSEISSRSATFNEIILASQRVLEVTNQLKNPADGNTSVYVLGIDISAQSPGPYNRQNVIELLASSATAPSFFREAATSDPQRQIEALLAALVQDLFQLSAGLRVVLHDQINTALFAYVPGSIRISGIRDGLLLKSPNQPVIIDPDDPEFTIYPKAALLPDVSDATVSSSGTIVIDFGVLPVGLLSNTSNTRISLSYLVQSNPLANGDQLPTNIDQETYVTFNEPSHQQSAAGVVVYDTPPRTLFFQSPTIACSCSPFAALSVLKVPDRSTAFAGEQVNYIIQVVNTGNLPLTSIKVDDALLGIHLTIPALAPLQSFVATFPYIVPPNTPIGPLTNTVVVTNEAFADPHTATAVVLIVNTPSLLFTKTVNKKQAHPGELVTFTLTTTNNGNIDLVNVRVTDPLLGIDTVIDRIPQGATITADFPYIIPLNATIGSIIVNVATTVVESLPPLTVGATVEVLDTSLLAIEKLVDRTQAAPGETVIFTLIVTNKGNAPLTNVRVTDPTLGLDTTLPSLAAQQSTPITFPFLIPLETTPKTYFNTAAAISDQTGPVEGSAQLEVLPTPAVGLAKKADRLTAAPGETIQYELIVANPGNVALGPFRLTDELLGIDQTVSGLAVGESQRFEATYTVPLNALIGSTIANLASAVSPEAGTVQAEAIVTVVGAVLGLSKSVEPAFAMPGQTVFYHLSVTNLSSSPQTNVRLIDATLGLSETVPLLQGGETIVRTIPFVIPNVPDGTVIPNRFTCSSDQALEQSAEAEVVAYTELTSTALRVTKLPNGTVAAPGGTIVYAVTVANIGAATATDIIIRDSLTGTQQRIAVLVADEERIVTFSYDVPAHTAQGTIVRNRVIVTSPQTDPVESEADVIIALPHFLLQLTNVVDRPVAEPGSLVYFTVTVRNNSVFTLTNVRIFENLTAFTTSLPSLAPGESRAFTLPFRIPPDAIGGTEYVSIATAYSNETPFEQAPASTVTFTIPDFKIRETVDRPVVFGGETVHFTITSTNTGNVDLIRYRFAAPLLGVVFQTERFPIGAVITGRFPFVTPETDEDIVIPSPVTGQADNAGPKQAEASVIVIPEDDE